MVEIITAEARIAEAKNAKTKLLLQGVPGIGKTSQLKTFKEPWLFIDMEGGDMAVMDTAVDSLRIRTWEDALDIACLVGGVDPSVATGDFSNEHFERAEAKYGKREKVLGKYSGIFFDSLTVMSRLCLKWAFDQPECLNKQGVLDKRAGYGILASSMMKLLTHCQHTRDKHIVFVSILEWVVDDYGRGAWVMQAEGAKIARELPGIVDVCLVMAMEKAGQKDANGADIMARCMFTNADNEYGYPAKDRSGKLDAKEAPDLQKILNKIQSK